MEENQNYYEADKLPENKPSKGGKGSGKGLFLAGLVTGLASALLIVAICYVAFNLEEAVDNWTDENKAVYLTEGSVMNRDTYDKLLMLEKIIKKRFYLWEVSDEELRDGMFRGMMEAIGDPYTEYYTEEELFELLEQSEGYFYGIGANVKVDTVTGLPMISGIIRNSPAEEAQLRAKDIIYEVDGASVSGLTLSEAVALIRGPEGTKVTLTISREGESDYLKVTVTRRRVESPTVVYTLLEDDMAWIQVTEFDDVTVAQFREALSMAEQDHAGGIILDLRGNPGGSLSAVVDMCKMMLPKGLIVYTVDKNGKRVEYKCDGKQQLNKPLVVLIDMNSASASEVMTGAIKDHGIGTLVGTTTYGKGIVQQIMPLDDGSAVKVTISAYYSPNGTNIHGVGIEPDVICEFDSDYYYSSEDHPDNQLEKAMEVLREKMNEH